MKKHRFWAWAMIVCLFMTIYTGYKHKQAEKWEVIQMLECFRKIDGKKTGIFAAGVLFGTAGIKILASKDAKKLYTNCTAAVLRAKECVMKTAATIQENAEDIYAEAQQMNEERAEAEIEELEEEEACFEEVVSEDSVTEQKE